MSLTHPLPIKEVSMNNPFSNSWRASHTDERRSERALAELEARHAESQRTIPCGKCSWPAYYRPGVGSWQCGTCGAVLSYNEEWR
jgi:hypothetical protein